MRATDLRRCLEDYGLTEISAGMWLYQNTDDGPYLYTFDVHDDEVDVSDAVNSLWHQLPNTRTRDAIMECIHDSVC